MNSWKDTLAERFRNARGSKTQADLAVKSGVSQRAISFIENKQLIWFPKSETLIRLALATRQDPGDWFDEIGLPGPEEKTALRLKSDVDRRPELAVHSRQARRAPQDVWGSVSYEELCDRESRIEAGYEVWVAQVGRFFHSTRKTSFDILLKNINERQIRYRFFYPALETIKLRPEIWGSNFEEDIRALQGRTSGEAVKGYAVDPARFDLFAINTAFILFVKPQGLPAEQSCWRFFPYQGGALEDSEDSRNKIFEFLGGVVHETDPEVSR